MTADDDRDVSPYLEALDRAHQAQTRYDTARQLVAEGTRETARDERIRFQQFVLALWKRLRPFMKYRLEKYWEDAWVYGDDSVGIKGLRELKPYQGAVTEDATFGPDDSYQQSSEPALLPPGALRNALDLLTEVAYHLELLPEAKDERPVGIVGDPDDNDPAEVKHEHDEQATHNPEPAGD
jgi:hypothetical protein